MLLLVLVLDEFLPAFSIVPNPYASQNRHCGATSNQGIEDEDDDEDDYDFRDRRNRNGRTESGASDEHFRQTLRASDHCIMASR